MKDEHEEASSSSFILHPSSFWERWDTPPRRDVPELLDDAAQPYADFRASLRDVRRVNRFLGGAAVAARQARAWLREAKARGGDRPVTFLDVATGSGDIPLALARLARREGVAARVVGLDFSAPVVRAAREEVGGEGAARLVRGDAFRLPFADGAFDYVLCSLAFHHWGFGGSARALREMERVARRGWLVNDLRRARSAHALIRVVTPLAGANRLTRHDAPASVLRAYSVAEYAAMPEALGLRVGREVALRRALFYRVALVREKRAGG